MTCPADHKHESTCYVIHRCRCDRCRAFSRARERERNRLKAYGRYDSGLVDIKPVQAHIRVLQRFGIGPKTIGRLAHVQPRKITDILAGEHDRGDGVMVRLRRTSRGPAERILAVKPVLENAPDWAKVRSFPYVRMVRALCALGWSQSAVARAVGSEPTNFVLVTRPPRRIRASTARKVLAVYERLCMQAPPERTATERAIAAKSRRRARVSGWPMPMDWEAGDFYRDQPVKRSAA